jgi:hypothetical protein
VKAEHDLLLIIFSITAIMMPFAKPNPKDLSRSIRIYADLDFPRRLSDFIERDQAYSHPPLHPVVIKLRGVPGISEPPKKSETDLPPCRRAARHPAGCDRGRIASPPPNSCSTLAYLVLFTLVIMVNVSLSGVERASMRRSRALSAKGGAAGFGLLEAIMSMGLIMLIALTTTQTFLISNRIAATIVQRNLDTALSIRFDGATEPPVLELTNPLTHPDGEVYDDDGGGDDQVNILIQKTATTQTTLVKGTLKRIVLAEPNPQGANIRRITFRLSYKFQRRDFNVDMTALRAIDD